MERLFRKIRRGKVRVKKSEYAKNPDGTPVVILERKTTRGKWLRVA
jgi:hypothetical protein